MGTYDVSTSICCWCDLLGFGTNLVKAQWDLGDDLCKHNLDRLKALSTVFENSMALEHPNKMSFNDSFASTIDLNENDESSLRNLIYFLDGVMGDFNMANYIDREGGFPGVRGVISLGSRYQYTNCQATEEMNGRLNCFTPLGFQMNTAFSKAFLIEECGSKAGIVGPNLYIDAEVFRFIENRFKKAKSKMPEFQRINDNTVKYIFGGNNLVLDSTPIEFGEGKGYENRGISTTLYRFKSIYSFINKMYGQFDPVQPKE
jgi:hypothetical protein